MVLALLGAWAVIALSSSTSPSPRCNEEWKIIFKNTDTSPGLSTTEQHTGPADEMFYPGLKSLILQ